jgi:ribosomal protein L11 methyltransferase
LDVGTGSGILAILAAKMGATRVVGIDKDQTAIKVARRNIKRNHVDPVVHIGSERIETLLGCFDFVVANIDLPTLAESAAKLVSSVCQGGRLILSGILEEESRELRGLLLREGLQLIEEKTREGWGCLVFRQP